MPRNAKATLFLCSLLVIQLWFGILFSYIPAFQSAPFLLRMTITNFVLYAIPLFIFFKLTRWPVFETLPLRPIKAGDLALVILIAFVAQPIMNFLSAIGGLFSQNLVADALVSYQDISIISLIISLAVYPAIFEEIIFRGLVFSSYRNTSAKTAILMTGLLFGLMHQNIQQFFYAAALGVIFCFISYRTGSLAYSMIAHFLVNAVQIVIAKLSIAYYAANDIAYTTTYASMDEAVMTLLFSGLMALLFLPLLVLGLRQLARRNPVKKRLPALADEASLDYHPLPGTEEKVLNPPFYMLLAAFFVFSFLL